MTEQEKQRLNDLEERTAYLLARLDEQDAKMNQMIARLNYIEARQYRLMKDLGIKPESLDTPQAALQDAKEINLTYVSLLRLN